MAPNLLQLALHRVGEGRLEQVLAVREFSTALVRALDALPEPSNDRCTASAATVAGALGSPAGAGRLVQPAPEQRAQLPHIPR